jgi:cysteine synthase A
MPVTSIADSVLNAIGGTRVVRLRQIVGAADADVVIKLEALNPTGSYKDRLALAMIGGAEARGALRPRTGTASRSRRG